MKNFVNAVCALAILLSFNSDAYSDDKDSLRKESKPKETFLRAHLHGLQEVPVVATVATGQLRARINPGDTSIDYELTYSGMQANVTQAHIHVAQRNVNGGIVLWFCGSTILTPPTTGPAGTPTCTNGSGVFTGTFTSGERPSCRHSANPSQRPCQSHCCPAGRCCLCQRTLGALARGRDPRPDQSRGRQTPRPLAMRAAAFHLEPGSRMSVRESGFVLGERDLFVGVFDVLAKKVYHLGRRG